MTRPTTYVQPNSLEDALTRSSQPGAVALAGGALLFGGLDLPFDTVVDLAHLQELRHLESDNGGLSVGSAVFLEDVALFPDAPRPLRAAITRALPLNIRNRTSVGETLLLQEPPAEWLAVLVALGTEVEHIGPGVHDRHRQPLADFIRAPRRHQPGMIVTRLVIPALPPRAAVGAAFVARTPADAPIVNAAVAVALSGDRRVASVRAAVCGASREPVLPLDLPSLVGQPLDDANIASAVKAVAPAVDPQPDYLGSVEYRREMARVMVQRALHDAMARL